MRGRKEWSRTFLETVQASLLFLFADSVHPLLEMSSGDLCISSFLSLLFDLKHAPSVLLVHTAVLLSLLGFFEFKFKIRSTSSPGVYLGLHFVALAL